MQRTEVAEKIRKLLRLAESADTVGEAGAAAARAQALADKHALDLGELIVDPGDQQFSDHPDEPLDVMRMTEAWRIGLACVVTNNNGCEILTESRETADWHRRAKQARKDKKRRPPRPTAILIVGPTKDVQTSRYIYAYLARTIDELAERNCKRKGRTFRRSYCMGAVNAIRIRMNEERQKVYEEARRAARYTTAIMRVDDAIRQRNEQLEAVRAWIEREIEIVHSDGFEPPSDANAYFQGARAARTIELGSDGPAITKGEATLSKGAREA